MKKKIFEEKSMIGENNKINKGLELLENDIIRKIFFSIITLLFLLAFVYRNFY